MGSTSTSIMNIDRKSCRLTTQNNVSGCANKVVTVITEAPTYPGVAGQAPKSITTARQDWWVAPMSVNGGRAMNSSTLIVSEHLVVLRVGIFLLLMILTMYFLIT